MFGRHFLWRAACLVSLALLLPGGCVVTVEPTDNGDGNGDDGAGNGVTTITIRVINTTSTGLDPEVYIADEPVTRDELFVASRKYTDFGVFGLGVIAEHSSDSFTLECSAARVVGTAGGKFGDDIKNPVGSGTERFLAQDYQFRCGERITFTYSQTASGFNTTVIVE
jgi:hypothetical protein